MASRIIIEEKQPDESYLPVKAIGKDGKEIPPGLLKKISDGRYEWPTDNTDNQDQQ